jgi:PAS domain S-box-containing protein
MPQSRTIAAREPSGAPVGLEGFWQLATDLFAIIGDDGMLYALNPAWERVLGWSREQLSVQPLTALLHPDDLASTATLLARTGEAGVRVDDIESRWRRPDGSYRTLAWNGSSDGDVWCVVGRDITGRARERTLLRDAQRIVELTNWEWNLAVDHVSTAFVADALLDDMPPARFGLEGLLARVPPEDRDAIREGLTALRAGTIDDARLEHRVLAPDGQIRWLDSRCRLLRDADGTPCAVRGTSQDITERIEAREDLRDAADFWQGTMDALAAPVAVLDGNAMIIAANHAWRRSGGAVGTCYAAPDPRAAAGIRGLLSGDGDPFAMELAAPGPDGEERWFALRATRFEGTGPVRVVIAHHDITVRRAMEDEALTQAALLDEIDVAVIATDGDGIVTHWNRGARVLYGWTREEATGRPAAELTAMAGGGRSVGRMTLRRKDGTTFPAHVRDSVMARGDDRAPGRIGVSMDITATIAVEQSLTDARNHLAAVTDSMGEGLLVLDRDGQVTLVNQAAEELLGWPSELLCGCRVDDLVAPGAPDGGTIAETLERGATIRVEDAAFVRRDGTALPTSYTVAPLITAGGHEGCVVVFDDATARQAERLELRRKLDALSWAGRVQDALREDRFVLYAQPILDLATGATVQHELLLRVREPDGTISRPGPYLKIAEEHGLIGAIDRWVIARGAELAADGLPVELNVSGASIGDPTLLAYIEDTLRDSGAEPELMIFEITETALIGDEQAGRAFVQRIHELGCKLALDDFGTGYGGFTYLKQLPLDYLKIDIEFVRDLRTSTASLHVVEAVVNLARGFGLKTVAEGIEDQETLALLEALGVDFAQGFHIARPGPLDDTIRAGHARSLPA